MAKERPALWESGVDELLMPLTAVFKCPLEPRHKMERQASWREKRLENGSPDHSVLSAGAPQSQFVPALLDMEQVLWSQPTTLCEFCLGDTTAMDHRPGLPLKACPLVCSVLASELRC